MNHWASFLGHVIGSKVLIDGLTLPTVGYEKISTPLQEMEGWAEVFNSLDLDKPESWVYTTKRLVRKIGARDVKLKEREPINLFDAMVKELDYGTFNYDWFLAEQVRKAAKEAPKRLLMTDETHTYWVHDLGDNCFILSKKHKPKKYKEGEDEQDADNSYGYSGASGAGYGTGTHFAGELYIPGGAPTDKRKAKWIAAVGEVALKGRQFLTLDWDDKKDKVNLEELKFPERIYEGPSLDLMHYWKRFMDKGVRRCVCLQGDPGTGKSTLTRTVAMKLNLRTLQIHPRAFTNLGFSGWQYVMKMVNPDVVILDDIDRIYNLENYLDRFEDAYYQVPLTMFTSNDLEEIPDAMLRPGRIDELIELEDPPAHIRLDIMRKFAVMEGAGEIPDWKIPFMEALYEEYTGAYVVEYLRRISVEGWDYRLPQNDLTYPELVRLQDELDPRSNPEARTELYLEAIGKTKPRSEIVFEPCSDGGPDTLKTVTFNDPVCEDPGPETVS